MPTPSLFLSFPLPLLPSSSLPAQAWGAAHPSLLTYVAVSSGTSDAGRRASPVSLHHPPPPLASPSHTHPSPWATPSPTHLSPWASPSPTHPLPLGRSSPTWPSLPGRLMQTSPRWGSGRLEDTLALLPGAPTLRIHPYLVQVRGFGTRQWGQRERSRGRKRQQTHRWPAWRWRGAWTRRDRSHPGPPTPCRCVPGDGPPGKALVAHIQSPHVRYAFAPPG